MHYFGSIEKLYTNFSPSRWGYWVSRTKECLTNPCITLEMVDVLYNTKNVAKTIVENQFVGLYRMSTAREQYNTSQVSLAADLFLSKYGKTCSLYELMIYFANYLIEFKGSFAQFDVQDILQQYKKKFIPWRANRLNAHVIPKKESEANKVRGIQAKHAYLKECVKEGKDLRTGGLYMLGLVTDSEIESVKDEIANGIF